MRAPRLVRGWIARAVEDALEDALDVVDSHDLDLDELSEQSAGLEERVDYLEGLDLEERVDRVEGLEVRVGVCETEGAVDRVRLEELERRYLALEHAVGVFAGTGDAAALFEHVRQAAENGGQS